MVKLNLSLRILLVLIVSIIAVQAVILAVSLPGERGRIHDHHRFSTSIVAATVDPDRVNDEAFLKSLTERLKSFEIAEVRAASDEPVGEYKFIETLGKPLMSYSNGVVAVEADLSAVDSLVRAYIWRTIGSTLVVVAVLVVVSFFFLRVVLVSPLQSLLKNLVGITGKEGDLTQRLRIRSQDEIGEIALRFNSFVESIRNMVGEMKSVAGASGEIGRRLSESAGTSSSHLGVITETTESVRTRVENLNAGIHNAVSAINEISTSISNMAGSIENQALAVSDALAAIEEINSSIQSMARIVTQKKEGADALLQVAQSGLERMSESNRAIGVIQESTHQTLEMIDVINTIAGQTNLLSINAAIEAAHAGDSGRGFAVVADEINKLSELTADNAKSINTTLRADADSINSAGEVNRGAADAFEKIVQEIQEVVDAMSELVAGMDELSVASVEIVKALGEVNQVTEDIKNASSEINTGTASIDESMETVSTVSSDVAEKMENITAEITHIAQAVADVSETGEANEKNIANLGDEVNRFHT